MHNRYDYGTDYDNVYILGIGINCKNLGIYNFNNFHLIQ